MKNLITLWLVLLCTPAFSQFVHQSTLIGTGSVNTSNIPSSLQGSAVAISADGMVAVVCGSSDSAGVGAAWVYERNGSQWVQMGKKLRPKDFTPVSFTSGVAFGSSVAISADGNTIAIGGELNNNKIGSTWIFVRQGNSWVQQGLKLTGNQTTYAYQGETISLSADGNTLLVGGSKDAGGTGSAWVFQRTGTTWAQQGNKLAVTPNNGWLFGVSVALSADGNTALIGAPNEGPLSNNQGYGYIFKRTGTTWNFIQKITEPTIINAGIAGGVAVSGNAHTIALGGPYTTNGEGVLIIFTYNATTQQYVKQQILMPTGASVGTQIGHKIYLSKGGDTLVTSGYKDNTRQGAVWTFVRNNGNWSQLGSKIISPITGGTEPKFGFSVSLSADGKIMIVGRPNGLGQGAAFVYTDSRINLGTPGEELLTELKLYPNPVQDKLNLPQHQKLTALTVSDLTGKLLLRQEKPGPQLDLSSFSPGIYIVSLQQQDKVQHVRVVKK